MHELGLARANGARMIRHPRFAFSLLLVSAACATLTVTGCGDSASSAPPGAAVSEAAEPQDDLHEADDPSLPAPNDDPALGAEIDVDTPELAAADQVEDVQDDVFDESSVDEEIGTSVQALTRVGSPVPGKRVTYAFGVRNPRYAAGYHTGQDYAAPVGRRVVAVRSGRIRWSNNNGGAYGKWIGLDADNGRTYVYCHLSSRLVAAGTRVTAGKLIGRVGRTGNVTGPHLHFEDHPRGPFVYARVRKPRW